MPEITMINLTGGGTEMRVICTQQMIMEMSYQATAELSRALADKIAAKVFKENKKKIVAALDIEKMTAEIEKILLDKIRKHQSTLTP